MLCWDCVNSKGGLLDLLDSLTSRVIGAETSTKKPLKGVIGYGVTTRWDTPREEAANLPRMLEEAAARQTRFGAMPGVRTSGTRDPGLRHDSRAKTRLASLQGVFIDLVLDTAKATRQYPPLRASWGSWARWVQVEITTVRCMTTAPEHLAALRRASTSALEAVDCPSPPAYLGPCTTQGCTGEFWAADGDRWVACPRCTARVAVEERKAQLRDQAESMWLTAREIENLSPLLVGERIPDSTIDAWRRRGQIASTGDPARFLLGDVLAKLQAREERRAQKSKKTA